jgi:beta-lactamase regulating signal transducer with metallopeptidase domain
MLEYLIKSSACLAVFMLFYKLFLEKENMHVFKRFYLLTSLLISIGIPFITFTQFVEVPINLNDLTLSKATNSITIQEETINYLPYILWSIYVLGVVIFSLKFSFNLSKISLKIKRNPKLKTQKSIHVLLEELIVPHTFLSYIFLNKTHFETQQIPAEVLIHEETHVIQKHSLDIIFIELFQILFWFNPLIYLLKNSIKLNHEFLADQEVIKKGVALSKYQQILLAFSSNALEPQLATAINYSSIKKRFTVMKTSSSKTGIWLRSIVLLPIIALLIFSFSTKKIIEEEIKSDSKITNVVQQELIPTINGVLCEFCTVNLSKEGAEKLILGTNSDEAVTSFLIKFIGKPTVSVKGNKLNKEAIALVNENDPLKMIQIFSIKTTNSSIPMPILIQMVDKNDENYSNSPIVKKGETGKIPPPPKAPEMKMAHDLPPPPPIPADATPEEKTKYQKTIDEYYKSHSKMVKKGEESNIPPPPPPPKSPLDFVIDMAKKDATFYFGGKLITSDQAIKMLKENKSLNISSKNSSDKNPKVYISKEPITID